MVFEILAIWVICAPVTIYFFCLMAWDTGDVTIGDMLFFIPFVALGPLGMVATMFVWAVTRDKADSFFGTPVFKKPRQK